MLPIFVSVVLALSSVAAVTQDASARTVQYHSQDIVPIHAKLKYTTLIQVPPTEKIMEAATGDRDFWVVDVVGNFCFVHPAKAGSHTTQRIIGPVSTNHYRRFHPDRTRHFFMATSPALAKPQGKVTGSRPVFRNVVGGWDLN